MSPDGDRESDLEVDQETALYEHQEELNGHAAEDIDDEVVWR